MHLLCSSAPALGALLLLTSGCVLSHHPTTLGPVAPASATTIDEVLAQTGVISHEAIVSARWEADLGGLVNLDDPKAQAAGLVDERVPVVLLVHVLRHPTAGVFVIDTGVCQDMVDGGHGALRGLLRAAAGGMEPDDSLGAIVARQDAPMAGVLITHMHIDHVLGLPDIPVDVPIHIGPGETGARDARYLLTRRTYRALLRDRGALLSWDWEHSTDLGDGLMGIDIIGDGSLWALESGGHTPGSTAFLAMTTDGPQLMVGDTSHTWFGWDNGVIPGGFTADADKNARSLERLRALSAAHPEIVVHVGHEPSR